MKKWLIIAGSLVVLLVLVALVLPLVISANTFKPMLERDLSGALGRQVTIGNISVSILTGSVAVDSFTVADDPVFSPAPFLSAQRLSAGVARWPLLISRRLVINSLTISAPRIALLRAASGRWNYSSLGTPAPGAGSTAAPAGAAPGNSFFVGALRLTDGSITVGDAGSARRRTYSGVNLAAANVSYASAFPFHLTAATPGGGSVQLDGRAGPVNAADASLTPFQLTLGVKNFDLAATGFIPPSAGIGGTLAFDATLNSDGRQAVSQGTLQASQVRLAPNSTPATIPVAINYATTYDLRTGAGTLSHGAVRIGKALAQLAGAYNLAGAAPMLDLKLNGAAMPATDLQGVFPALGMVLPAGAVLQSGALDATLAFSGPLDKLVISGNINLANARLAGFNLGGKLGAMTAFAGLGKAGTDTEIQSLSSAVRVDASGTALQNLVAVVPAIGTLTGNASVNPAGQLDCRMTARLAANAITNMIGIEANKASQSKLGGLLGGALRSLGGGGAATGSSAGGLTIPFRLTGTTAQPVFTPDLGLQH